MQTFTEDSNVSIIFQGKVIPGDTWASRSEAGKENNSLEGMLSSELPWLLNLAGELHETLQNMPLKCRKGKTRKLVYLFSSLYTFD